MLAITFDFFTAFVTYWFIDLVLVIVNWVIKI